MAGRTGDGRPLIVLGLTQDNVDRLLAGKPIAVDAEKLGLPPMAIVLTAAADNQALVDMLCEAGLLTPPEGLMATAPGSHGKPKRE